MFQVTHEFYNLHIPATLHKRPTLLGATALSHNFEKCAFNFFAMATLEPFALILRRLQYF